MRDRRKGVPLALCVVGLSLGCFFDFGGLTGGQVDGGSAPVVALRQTHRASVDSSASVNGSFDQPPLPGSLVCVTLFSNSAVSPTGLSGGGVSGWNTGPNSNPVQGVMVTYWGVVGSSPSAAVTATLSGTAVYVEMFMVELTGVTTVDVSDTNAGTGTTVTVPTLTLSGPAEVVVTQSWIMAGAVSSVTSNGFTNSFSPVGVGPGVFQSYLLLGAAQSYFPERYVQPNGGWYSQAIAFK